MATIDEFLVGLGFEYDPSELEEFKNGVDSTVETIKVLSKIALAGAAAITAMVTASTAGTDETVKFSREIGESAANVEALTFALKRAGGESSGMQNSLRNLSKVSSEAARGIGSGVEVFGILGISATDSNGQIKQSAQLMQEVSGAMQGLSKQRQIELADKLGLGDSILLLQQGPKEIRSLMAEARALGVTTAEDAAQAERFQDTLTDLWQITKSMARSISTVLVPILEEMTGVFKEWWINNREMIEQDLPGWIDTLKKGLKLLTVAAGLFVASKLIGNMMMLVKLFKSGALAAMILNGTILTIPALMAVAIAAFVLLAEDINTFLEGGDSLIGRLMEKFPMLGRKIQPIVDLFSILKESTKFILKGWNEIFKLFSSEESFGDIVKHLPGFIFESGLKKRQPVDAGSISSNNSVSRTTQIGKIEFKIDGSKSPEATANAISESLRQASIDLNSPVVQ